MWKYSRNHISITQPLSGCTCAHWWRGRGGSSAFPSSLIAMWHCWLLHGFRRKHKQTTPWLYQLTELSRDISPEQNEQTIRNSWYYMPKVLRSWTCPIDSTAFDRNARLMWYDCSLVQCSPTLSDTFCTLFSPQALDTVLSLNIIKDFFRLQIFSSVWSYQFPPTS